MSPAHNRRKSDDNKMNTEAWANEDRRHAPNAEGRSTTEDRRIVVDHMNYSEPINESQFHVQTNSKKSGTPILTKIKSDRSDFEKQTIVTDTQMRTESVQGYDQEQRTLDGTKQENKESHQGSLTDTEILLKYGRNTPAEKQIYVNNNDQYVRADVKRVSNANDRSDSPLNPHTMMPPITTRVEYETSRLNNDREIATTYQPGTKETVKRQDTADDHHAVKNDQLGPVIAATVGGSVASGNDNTRPDSPTRTNEQNDASDVSVRSGPTTAYGTTAVHADTSIPEGNNDGHEHNSEGQHVERPNRDNYQGYTQSGPYVAAEMDEQVVARSYERDERDNRSSTNMVNVEHTDLRGSINANASQKENEKSTEPGDKPTIGGQMVANGNERTTENNVINASFNGEMKANVSLQNGSLPNEKVSEPRGKSNSEQTIDNGIRTNDDKESNRADGPDISVGIADNHPASNDDNNTHTFNADISVSIDNEATTGPPVDHADNNDAPDDVDVNVDASSNNAIKTGQNTQGPALENAPKSTEKRGDQPNVQTAIAGSAAVPTGDVVRDANSNATQREPAKVEPISSQSVKASDKPTQQGQPNDVSAPTGPVPRQPTTKSSNKQAPNNKRENQPPKKNRMKDMSQNELNNCIEALDKLVDHDLRTLINGSRNDSVKPDIDEKILQKVMSDEFQAEMDQFLQE